MRHLLRLACLGLMAGVLALLTCSCGFVFSPEDLYSLPSLPAEYTELNNCINQIIDSGAEYAAPVSGTNIQPVQMKDLDGDGQQEAVAFFRNSADEKPLKICIFTAVGDTYEQSAVIEGSGTAIYSIEYSDLDNDGRQELIVGWRVSTDAQALTVYSLRTGQPEELMRTNYVKYAITDLDQDQMQELVVLRSDEEGSGLADYYCWQDGGVLNLGSSARISSTMAELSGQQGRVQKGTLRDGEPALFITGVEDSVWAITDILAAREGELYNLLLSDMTGVSGEIVAYQGLVPTDINSDGITELPQPVVTLGQDNSASQGQWVNWRTYDSAGTAELALSTYHNMEDGWYLQLPKEWQGRVMVSRSVGLDEAVVTFSILGENVGDPAQEFLKITTLTGSSREIKATRGGRIILRRQVERIFTAELLEANATWEYGLTEDEIQTAFNLITTEWIAGDN